MLIYRGDSLYKFETISLKDTSKSKQDSIKNAGRKTPLKDSLTTSYPVGTAIAMFPNTDYNKLAKKSSAEIYQVLLRNGLQVFFSQRYQGDHFLNWVFNYF